MHGEKLRKLGRLAVACTAVAAVAFAAAAVTAQPGAAAPGAVLHSATGSAETAVNGVSRGRTLSFSAIQLANGKVEGQARVVNHVNGFTVVVDITCLRVTKHVVLPNGTTGDFAEVSGVVAVGGDEVGSMRSFNMLDTGEGAGAPPDLINYFTWGSDPGTSCDDSYPPPDPGFLVPVEAGNVQVN
jgi:hypothetical protein